jgi:uncharacterized OB-fold protein
MKYEKIYVNKIPCDDCGKVTIPMKVGSHICEKCGGTTEIIKMEKAPETGKGIH